MRAAIVPKEGRVMRVKQDPEKPVEKEVLAEAVVRIGEAYEALRRSGVNHRGVIVLLHDYTKVSKRTIEDVLEGLADLRKVYCK